MNVIDEEIAKILNIDPIALAEEKSGKSYKEDEETLNNGVLNAFAINIQKNYILDLAGDTKLSMKASDYLVIAENIDFEIVGVEDFIDKWGLQEKFYILWNKKGILLYFDTYEGRVNSGDYCFNWVPKEEYGGKEDVFSLCHISGGFRKEKDNCRVLIGTIDCREALRTRISILENRGRFLDKWVEEPFYRLMHYEDWNSKKDQSEEITEERFNKLPDYVKIAMRSEL